MNDAERRGLVVLWMRETGDPWLATPQIPADGSDLAADDGTDPKVSPIARYGVATAIDHLGSVVDAIYPPGRPIRHWAHFTTLRTTLLSAARVIWMLTPEISTERSLRTAQIRYINAEEQLKAINEFTYGPMDSELRQKQQLAVDSMTAEMQTLAAQINALDSKVMRPFDTVSMLRELVDTGTWEGMATANLWRTGSAAAHGYHWTDTVRANAGAFDEEWFNTSLYGAALMLRRAFDLYNLRAAPPK